MKSFRNSDSGPSVEDAQSEAPVGTEGMSNSWLQSLLTSGKDLAVSGVEAIGDWMHGDEDQEATPGPACFVGPFERGATRGDFVWALSLQRPDLGLGRDREQVLKAATAAGVLTAGREDDEITRAEAATTIVRALGLGSELPDGGIAYFYDVMETDWYFESAHVARRFGLFLGGEGDNLFRGGDRLSVVEAEIVIGRAVSPAALEPANQVKGTKPILEPGGPLDLLAKDSLAPEEIAQVRASITRLDPSQQGEFYRQLAEKVSYANQRDNDATYAKADANALGWDDGDMMCNFTSIAMALQQLGVGPSGDRQFEDELDEAFIESPNYSNRYDRGERANFIEENYEIDVETHSIPGDPKGFFEETVLPAMQAGASVTMGNSGGPWYDYNHIVRVEWVNNEGLLIDDPYGQLGEVNTGKLVYSTNDNTSSTGDGAKGEDNEWPWSWLAKTGASYVQIYKNREPPMENS